MGIGPQITWSQVNTEILCGMLYRYKIVHFWIPFLLPRRVGGRELLGKGRPKSPKYPHLYSHILVHFSVLITCSKYEWDRNKSNSGSSQLLSTY